MKAHDLPLLRIACDEGEGALLGYKLTELEKAIFREMDTATAKLPEDSPLEMYHEAVTTVGSRHQLDSKQSIAFWTRATFSLFEQ